MIASMQRRKQAFACAAALGVVALGSAGKASAQTANDGTTTLNGSEQTLPFTGAEPGLIAGAGLLMAGAGLLLRRRLQPG